MHSHAYLTEIKSEVSIRFIFISDQLPNLKAHAILVKALRFEFYSKTQSKWVIG